MRIGCCVNMLAGEEDTTGSRWIPHLKECGYDYVELPLAQVMELPETEFQKLLELLSETGVPCECCNNFFQLPCALQGRMQIPLRRRNTWGVQSNVHPSWGQR